MDLRKTDYKQIPSTKENIDRYKTNYKNLKHVKTGDDYDGCMWIEKATDTFIAIVQCNIKTNYIVALEVSGKFRRQGIAKELLKVARQDYSAKYLSVSKKNDAAIKLYKESGWKVIDESDHMYFMEYK